VVSESILSSDARPGQLERPEAAVIWELRAAWGRMRTVRLTLSDRCLLPKVIGTVRRIAVTGAFVEIDGWEVPAEDILAVGIPTVEERDEYLEAKAEREALRSALVEPDVRP
jgi:hypothetical protein